MEGRGLAHELVVDTPQVADSFVSSLPVSGPAESRVETVSHRIQPAAQAPCPGRRPGSRLWEVVLKDQGQVSWALVQPTPHLRLQTTP